ncbi:MAG: hypothetical protein JRN16_04235 [Nitrososphaerota archaeon]|nr:hypothetical protein [Nitrososphaerota archaeon]MDG6973503.1 hypothetical protein [Nitrososphaerota archaeon]MDG6975071.1 hypothetical protein [Nitrososphaerota archaeon]MDG7009829.1 hypothetical protein [Nitrososphaerota archaeon]MDG7027602.1 hypothetical protein [Nitrososphaerota archaeon]
MLSFRVHQLEIGRLHFILLPKLNRAQSNFLVSAFERRGYSVEGRGRICARRRKETVHVEPPGYCWSAADPADLILPLVEDLLSFPKERVPPKELEDMYLLADRSSGRGAVRLSPRLETHSRWARLRKEGRCGLSPDEGLVASSLMGMSEGPCSMVTDYYSDGAVPVIWGRRRYFEASLSPEEASRTLRSVEAKGERNSYLPMGGSPLPGSTEVARGWASDVPLGEWCFFTSS